MHVALKGGGKLAGEIFLAVAVGVVYRWQNKQTNKQDVYYQSYSVTMSKQGNGKFDCMYIVWCSNFSRQIMFAETQH